MLTYADCCHLKATLGVKHSCVWCMPNQTTVIGGNEPSAQVGAVGTTDDDQARKSKQAADATALKND